MGVPVKSIRSFEDNVKYRNSKFFVIIILANAKSDSRAVEFVINNFHIMDTLSNDVDFYLPGYDIADKNTDYAEFREQQWYREMEKEEFLDFHNGKHFFIRKKNGFFSPRLGNVYFNEAEFADFVLQFTQKKKGYAYLGFCQMILMPVGRERNIDYNGSIVFDLDKIVNTHYGPSLDSFFHNTFHIIRGFHRPTFLEAIFGHTNSVMQKINDMYIEATHDRYSEDRYELAVNNIVLDMEKCLHWKLMEEYFFISYSSLNVMKAMMLKNILQKRGLKVWIAPDGIPQGREYSVIIPTALRFAKHFILLLTPESAQSRWVKRELDIAVNNESNTKVKVLLSDGYSIESVRRNEELSFYLNRVQIKYSYDAVISDNSILNSFISE